MDFVFDPCPRVTLSVAGREALFPVHRVYCVGRNYAEHAREMGHDPEREPPFFFAKPPDAVTQTAVVPYPPRTAELHHEVELVVAIGTGGRDIEVSRAAAHVYGYAVGVDLTRRDLQAAAKRRGRPWDTAKGFDQSAPVSAIVPAVVAGHPGSGRIRLSVDGVVRQQGDLADMIWSVPEIVAELSGYFELQAGDLIFTGTPAGVAALEPGSRVACSIDSRQSEPALVAAFYKFVELVDYAAMREPLQRRCVDLGLLGTILLAGEGINGTVSGPEGGVMRLLEGLRGDPRLADLEAKLSRAGEVPFYRMKVRLKKEIVSLGVSGVDPVGEVGEYVEPSAWNELISRPDVRLVDTRNDYEVHLGTFSGAENPGTRSFREFPEWVDQHLDPQRDEHVAMFCTGGIRCEKATALLRQKGFRHVYHLRGGILSYLEQVASDESLWTGECFVFDNRVTVDQHLRPGHYEVCPACRMPLTEADRAAPEFEPNVSCPRCFDRLTPEKREGLLERARQIALAAKRGDKHLGGR
jgi:UPF0176 protein